MGMMNKLKEMLHAITSYLTHCSDLKRENISLKSETVDAEEVADEILEGLKGGIARRKE